MEYFPKAKILFFEESAHLSVRIAASVAAVVLSLSGMHVLASG